VGVVNEVKEGQSMFQWMLENTVVDPCAHLLGGHLGASSNHHSSMPLGGALPSFVNFPEDLWNSENKPMHGFSQHVFASTAIFMKSLSCNFQVNLPNFRGNF
jgi:hypothetical protein